MQLVPERGGDGEGGVEAAEDGAEEEQLPHPEGRVFSGVMRLCCILPRKCNYHVCSTLETGYKVVICPTGNLL